MRPRRLLPAQFLSRGWTAAVGTAARGAHTTSKFAGVSSPSPSPASSPRSQSRLRRPPDRDKAPSIFQQLFPDKQAPPGKAAAASGAQQGRPVYFRKLRLPTVDKELRKFLDDVEHAKLAPGAVRAEDEDWAGAGGADEPTVLVLSCASKSLLPSDFYRHAPQGQHVDGWAGGLMKVVQARDRHTQEPRGQYYLFFDSRAAALAYSDEIKQLHHLSRARLGPRWRKAPESVLPPSEVGGGAEAADARARSYALLPPSIQLDLKLVPPGAILPGVRGKTGGRRAGRPRMESGGGSESEPGTPTPVSDSHKVLVVLAGGRITTRAVQDAIDADGADRNLAWRLWKPRESIFPLGVRPSRAQTGAAAAAAGGRKGDVEPVDDKSAADRYERFIICFAEAVEARRFARSWHKRPLLDPAMGREVKVNATVVW